jgi:glycogen debranching enzyme
VKKQLVTPVGLRTLSPDDPRYRPCYDGGVRERDSAYHQGTVWPFLLGPLVTAWIKSFGRNAKSRSAARGFLKGLEAHLSEGCLGQVSEIFDAEAPHHPRGCFAQAWSVAEPLRALIEDLRTSVKILQTPVKPSTIRQRQASPPTATPQTNRSTKAPKKPGTKARSTRRAP